jgi:hypothetical protein
MRSRLGRLAVASLLVLPAATARAGAPPEPSPEPDSPAEGDADQEALEDALFDGPVVTEPAAAENQPGENASEAAEDALFASPSSPPQAAPEGRFDPLAIGGQAYLRLTSSVADRGKASAQRLSMPNLIDLYLDARPDERVRAFVQGRLRYDPTAIGGQDLLGRPTQPTSALLDQLWLKTDIGRAVYLTVGQERIKWGASRLWNPTDFANLARRDPVAFFDERVGVPMVKVHVPWETLNVYALALLGGADHLGDLAGALRVEWAGASWEVSASAVAGAGRKTAFGMDLSAAVGPVDVTLEAALTDERATPVYSGAFDPAAGLLPTGTPDGRWRPAVSGSVLWSTGVFDNDLLTLGAEGFWNPIGAPDDSLYAWQLLTGALSPFYLGRAYAALFAFLPAPGSWDRWSFNLSALGNLSDRSGLVRLDAIATLHTRLRLEAFAQTHFGHRGGEFRFSLDVPELPPIPGVLPDGLAAFQIPAPAVGFGLNLRLSL